MRSHCRAPHICEKHGTCTYRTFQPHIRGFCASPSYPHAHLSAYDARSAGGTAYRCARRKCQLPKGCCRMTPKTASSSNLELPGCHRCCCSPLAAPCGGCSSGMQRKSPARSDPCRNATITHVRPQLAVMRIPRHASRVCFFQLARQAGRTGGERAHQRVYRGRIVQDRRAPGRTWRSTRSRTTSIFASGVDSKRRAVLVTVFSCLDRIFSHGLIGLDH